MSAAELIRDETRKKSKSIVTSGGVALIDATGAAKLLKASGVLESAKQHMHFYKVVRDKDGKRVLIHGDRKKK